MLGVFPRGEAPVTLVQTNQGLEEELRQMNGRIEELNFQILQLQEQLRKMQEDNEFRFKELEEKKSDAGGVSPAHKQAMTDPAQAPGSSVQAAAQPVPPALPADNAQLGAPPQDFGTITFDQAGNVVGGSVGDSAVVTRDPNAVLAPSSDESDATIVAALPRTDSPEDLYRSAYESILAGNYKVAEAGFRQHVENYPDDERAADAQFWLGESLLGQHKFREAAEVFLAANKKFPKAKKAPDTLFKLGVSLIGINQRDVGCATFAEVAKRYPNASPALKKRIEREQAEAKC